MEGPVMNAQHRSWRRRSFVMLVLAFGVHGAAGTAASGQTLPTEAVDRFITVNGLKLHYLDWGNEGKPPFIMLHGIARTAHTFDHVAKRYQKNYHVLAVDMRGHGDSEWDPKAQYLVEDYVKDIEAVVAQLKLKNIVMMGNS